MEVTKTPKFIMRHQELKQLQRPINMFLSCRNNETQFHNIKPYFVVGDLQFKDKFCRQHSANRLNKTLDKFDTLEETQPYTLANKTMQYDYHSILKHPTKLQQLQLTSQKRILNKIKSHKEKEQRIEKVLMKRLTLRKPIQLGNTMTFAKQQIQSYPNPQQIQLINDNIPEYWKNSLRDNQKRLKRHIRGNTYKRQIAQQMLQTMRGRKQLHQSIPKIKEQFLSPICSKDAHTTRRQGFSLKGRKTNYFIQQSNRKAFNKTMNQIPIVKFQQVHKIHYDSAHRWQASNLYQ